MKIRRSPPAPAPDCVLVTSAEPNGGCKSRASPPADVHPFPASFPRGAYEADPTALSADRSEWSLRDGSASAAFPPEWHPRGD